MYVYAHGFVWLLANHRTHFHKPSWCEANQIYLLNAQERKTTRNHPQLHLAYLVTSCMES